MQIMKKIKKAKRVNKNVVKNIRHKEYVGVLYKKRIVRDKMKRIQSQLHKIGTYSLQNFFILFWW